MPPRPLTAALLVFAAIALTACGDDEQTAGFGDRPTVVATTGFAADLVEQIAGDDAEVVQLVPDSANPHSYSASAKDRATLEDAALVVSFGRSYEEGLPLDEIGAAQFEIADAVGGPGAQEEDAEHAEEDDHAGEEHSHEAGAGDPHVWLDPTKLAAAAPGLADALARVDAASAAGYRERARTVAAELEELDAEIARTLAAVPDERRKLVTSHESLGHLAERYGFEFVGAPFGLAPETEASAQDIAALVDAVRSEQVPAVFAQAGDDPKVMRRVAEEAGVEVVDDLLVENPGPQGPTYAEAMRHTARRIAEALGG